MSLLFLLLLCLARSYGSNCEASCAVSCPYRRDIGKNWQMFNDRCYYWSKGRRNWTSAENFCKSAGGHLASVTDQRVHNFIKNELSKGKKATWIGGKREPGSDPGRKSFLWSDCSPRNYDEGWADGETNNAGGKQECLTYTYDQELNDEACAQSLSFVCTTDICPGKKHVIFFNVNCNEIIISR